MSIKRTPALLSLLVAIFVATLMMFAKFRDHTALAQTPAAGVQSSEAFGLSGGCQGGLGWVAFGGGCSEKISTSACTFSQKICTNVNGQGVCVSNPNGFEPNGTICAAGAFCQAASSCFDGQCIPGAIVNCSVKNVVDGPVVCQRWGCAASPGGTCEIIETAAPINAKCTETEEPIICGQKYWVRVTTDSPARCGGQACPADYQKDGPLCPKCSCAYLAPPSIYWGGTWCQNFCGLIGGPSTSAIYDVAGGCQCGQVPLKVCPATVDLTWRDITTWPLQPSKTSPSYCNPNVGGQTSTVCSWAALGTQTYGFTLAQGATPTVLGGVPGTFSYSYGLNALLPMGDSTITATFTPSDTTLYSGTTCTTSVTIQPKKTTCTVTSNTGTYGTTSSSLVSATAYDAQFSFITVNGSFAYTINGQPLTSSTVLDAGTTYPVVATFTPSDFGYAGTTCSGSLTISASSAICTVDSASRPYNTVLSKALGFVCKNGSTIITSGITGGTVAAPPAQNALPADYPVGFSSNPTSTNYTIQVVPGTVSVTAVDSSCVLPNQSVVSGTAVSFGGAGYIAGTSTGLAGTFVYKQGATVITDGSVFPTGTYTITANFTPSNAGYKPSTCSGTITVTDKPLQGTYCSVSATSVTYGTGVTFSSGAYDSSTRSAVAGTFTYTADGKAVSSGAVLAAKTGYAVTATFTPSVSGYAGSSCTTSFNVSPKSITVQVNNATVQYGQDIPTFTKADFIVDPLVAPDTKDGLFGVTVPTTTAKKGDPPKTYPITIVLPSNSNYSFNVINGTLTITQANSACALTGLTGQSVVQGTAISFGAQGYIGGTTTALAGGFVFKEGTTTVSDGTALALGTHTITGTFTPTDTSYKGATCTGTVVVTAPSQKPTYCVLTVSDVTYGTPSVFSGQAYDSASAAAVSGTFTYSLDSTTVASMAVSPGLILDAKNNYLLTGTFAPSSTTYAGSTCQNSFTVNKRPAVCTAGSASRPYNTVLAQAPGFVCEVVDATTGARTSVPVTGGAVSAPPAQDAVPGNYPITFTTFPTSTNYSLTFVAGNVEVTTVGSTCALSGLTGQSVTQGTAVGFGAKGFIAGTTSPLAGTWVFKEGATIVTSGSTSFTVASHTITGTFTPSNTAYTTSTCNGSFVVTAPAQTPTYCTVTVNSVSYGTGLPLSGTAKDGSGNAVGGTMTFTVNGATVQNGSILDAGDYKVVATFSPTLSSYAGTSCYGLFSITKPTAICTADSATRDYNTTLSSPLGFVCRVGGNVVTSGITGGALSAPPAQDALPQTYPITFTSLPTATNYIINTVNGAVTVSQLTSRCELSGLTGQTATYGSLVDTLPKGYIGATTTALAGSFLFKDGATDLPSGNNGIFQAGTVLPVGAHTISATFQPTNAGGYGLSQCSGTVTVAGCTSSAQCTVDDGNACTSNACCTLAGGCVVGTTSISTGQCYNKPITTPQGGLKPTLDLICPTDGAKVGQLKFTWPDNATCVDTQSSAYSYLVLASTMSAPVFTPTPGPSDVLSTTDTRARCSGGTCVVTRDVSASNFAPGLTIYGGVSIGTNGVWTSSYGTTSKTSTCAWCGDGVINNTEGCDGKTFPIGKTTGYRCNACKLEWCGDLIKNGAEECDGNGPGLPQCTSTCTITGKATSCTVSPTTITYGAGAAFNGVGKVSGTTTTLAGTFVYTLTAGTTTSTAKDGDILDAGTYSVSAKFLPTDPTYAGSTCTGSLTVNPVAATCTGDSKERPYNTANPVIGYTCLSGGVNINDKLSLGTFKLTDFPALTAAASTSPYLITFDVKPSNKNYSVTYTNGSIKVNKAPAACTIGSPTITAGSPITYAKFNPTMVPNGTMTYFNTTSNTNLIDGSTPTAGTYAIKATLTPTDGINYTASDCFGTLTVNKAITCSTLPLKLPTSKTFDQTFVTSGFTVTADVVLGGSWTFTVGGAPINYAQRPTTQITVSGTYQPINGGYSSVTCSTTVTPVQCTSSTVAQDCTADDGNACTDNACNAMNQCYNKYKGPSTGTLSPVITLTCPNTFKIEFNDVLACVDPNDVTALYRIGASPTNAIGWSAYPGTLLNMNSVTFPARCAGGKCAYTTTSIPSSNFLTGQTIYAGVAAFAAGALSKQESTSKAGACSVVTTPCNGKTCPAGTNLNTTTCNCDPVPQCGNGVLDVGEECDQSAGINGGCLGYGCVNCVIDYSATCASLFTETCTGTGSSLAIAWGPNLQYQVGTSIYSCPSDPSCCPPVSPTGNSSSQSAATYCASAPNGTFGHDYDISSACPHGKHVQPPSYHVSCTCNQGRSPLKRCLSAIDGVTDASLYLQEAF